MMINRIITCFILVFSLGFVSAQQCGNVATQMDIDRLLRNKANFKNQIHTRSNETVYIPVTFHIVRKTDGSKGIQEQRVIEQLCAWNNDYASMDIVFYLKDKQFNYINSTLLYESPANSAVSNTIIENKLGPGKNSVNVFICESANTGSGLGTTLGYYDPFQDIIVMKQSEVNANSGTLSHEGGHFFSLLHVHNGWDSEPWDAGDHGNPINNQNAPGGVLAERADGSNCENAGDYLCDTEADYNLGFGWSGCSTYTGGCKDIVGDLLDPEEENFMGYFIGCEEYNFSEDQKNMVLTDYESAGRSYIRVNYTPNANPIGQTTLSFPTNGETVNGYDYIQLDWETVENAIGYIVEVRLGILKTYYRTEKSDILLKDLSSDKLYSWKVMPFSEIGGCQGFSDAETFRTGLNTSTNGLQDFDLEVYPTILDNGAFNISVSQNVDADLELTNLSGQKMYAKSLALNKGQNNIQILQDLSQGIYFLNVHVDGKKQIFKVMVQ